MGAIFMKLKWYLFFLTIFTVSTVIYNYIDNQPVSSIKIGVLMIGESRYEKFTGLKKGLEDLGYEEKDISFLIKNANDQKDKLPILVDSLIKETPDILVTLGAAETLAVKDKLTKSEQKIPVVFVGVVAPKEMGIIQDYMSPNEPFTGINNYHTNLSAKRLEVFHDLIPSIERFHVLYDADIEISRLSLEKAEEAAKILSVAIIPENVADPAFFEKIEANVRKNDAILVLPGFRMESLTDEIIQLSKKNRLPVMGLYEHEVQEGFLTSYGASFYDLGYQAARYVSLIIQGNSPEDLPVELPDKIRFLINKEVKEELGITLNEDLLYIADLIDQSSNGGDGK